MVPDDLNAPLGQQKRKPPPRIGASQVLAALLILSGVVVAAWVVLVNDPLGGEPVVVVSAKPVATEPGERRHQGPENQLDVHAPPSPVIGSQTITIIDGTTGKRQKIVVPDKPAPRGS